MSDTTGETPIKGFMKLTDSKESSTVYIKKSRVSSISEIHGNCSLVSFEGIAISVKESVNTVIDKMNEVQQ